MLGSGLGLDTHEGGLGQGSSGILYPSGAVDYTSGLDIHDGGIGQNSKRR